MGRDRRRPDLQQRGNIEPAAQNCAHPAASGPKCRSPVLHLSSHAAKRAKQLGKNAPAVKRWASVAQNPVDPEVDNQRTKRRMSQLRATTVNPTFNSADTVDTTA
ncbi:hypothetical protein BJ742DRAFT_768851 [Cladochytrium replicatum]|nr:hypothetical protein BJ742DRAFT_768851 [Cladochytrium replicatum]